MRSRSITRCSADASRITIASLCGGEFTAQVAHAGKTSTHEGNFKGSINPPVARDVSIWDTELKSDKPSSYGNERLLDGNGGMSHGGWFSQGFGAIPDETKPALLWLYHHYVAAADQNRRDTLNYPHRAILALVNWPIGVPEKNPAEILACTSVDRLHGWYVFRNGWR